jgi:hypothetical protein
VGKGPVRTGVTAILPRGRKGAGTACAAGYYALNGNGEMTGMVWIEEAGELQTPITITNTHSCGVTRDATIRWQVDRGIGTGQDWGLPVAAETYDGDLNDINGFHVMAEHTLAALDGAKGGAVELGSVGGGTGMIWSQSVPNWGALTTRDLDGDGHPDIWALGNRGGLFLYRSLGGFQFAQPEFDGKSVLLVDDGLATGLTTEAAALAVRKMGAQTITVAAPVAYATPSPHRRDGAQPTLSGFGARWNARWIRRPS